MLRAGPNQADVQAGCPGNTCIAKADNLPSNQNSYQLTGMTAGTTYYWRVVTFSSTTCYKDAASSFVAPAAATVTPTPYPPTPTLTATPVANAVVCAPASQTVTVGQAANFQASGGDGANYTWSGNGQTSTGSTASFTFTTSGTKQVNVISGSGQASCTVSVTGAISGNVGGVKTGPGDAVLAALLVSSVTFRLSLLALAGSVSVLFIFGMVLRKAPVWEPAAPDEESTSG